MRAGERYVLYNNSVIQVTGVRLRCAAYDEVSLAQAHVSHLAKAKERWQVGLSNPESIELGSLLREGLQVILYLAPQSWNGCM